MCQIGQNGGNGGMQESRRLGFTGTEQYERGGARVAISSLLRTAYHEREYCSHLTIVKIKNTGVEYTRLRITVLREGFEYIHSVLSEAKQ